MISVSVIIPVYDTEQYLEGCIESVLSQTLSNIEVICIDDCSRDASPRILKEYQCREDRIVVVTHSGNRGAATARNTGLAIAKGEYVFFIDSDDLLFSRDSLEHLHNLAIADGVDEIIGATLLWSEDTEERILDYYSKNIDNEHRKIKFDDYQHLRCNAIACNKLIKHSYLVENGIRFNTKLKKYEDNPFSWSVHLFAGSISLTKQVTYLYRQRSEYSKTSTMQKKEDNCYHHQAVAMDVIEFLDEHREFALLRHNFDRYLFQWLRNDVVESNNRDVLPDIKNRVLNVYMPVLSKVPDYSMDALWEGNKRILNLMRNGDTDGAWEAILKGQSIDKVTRYNDMEDTQKKITGLVKSSQKADGTLGMAPIAEYLSIERISRATVRLASRPVTILFTTLVIGAMATALLAAGTIGVLNATLSLEIVAMGVFAEILILCVLWLHYAGLFENRRGEGDKGHLLNQIVG